MSSEIDEKVLAMRFDNRDFERNVSTSLQSIEKLKKGLKFDNTSDGIENVGKSISGLPLNGLSKGMDTIKAKFSAWQVVAMTAISNITTGMMNLAKNTIRQFTIEPITTGFQEYELKMGAIQTIMASTGESLETVNKYLDELNKYSDDTIYSFSDMTNNIGKFTNAGVKLEDAVAAIKGVANEAALSGANANEASRAMYNFGQALSAGCVKLIDWKSIDNANMATVSFKQELLDTALALGTVTKEGDKYRSTTVDGNGRMSELFTSTEKFNESLSAQWMTTEVLTQTLRRYADTTTEIGEKATQAATEVKTFSMMMDTLKEAAQSGWAQTWEIIAGDFNQGKTLWTKLSDFISGILIETSDARNALAEAWADNGGRDAAINSLFNILNNVVNVIKAVRDGFFDIFPKVTAEQLVAITKNFEKLTKKLLLGKEGLDAVRKGAKGVFAILSIIIEPIKQLIIGIASLSKNFKGININIGGALTAFGDWASSLNDTVKETNIFGEAIGFVVGLIQKAIDKIKEFVSTIAAGLSDGQYDEFVGFFKGVFGFAYKLITATVKAVVKLSKELAEAFNKENIFEVFNDAAFGGVLVNLIKLIKNGASAVDSFKSIGDSIKGILTNVGSVFESWQKNIKAGTLKKIAEAVALLAASLLIIGFIDQDKLASSLGALGGMMGSLIGAMALFSRIEPKGVSAAMQLTVMMRSLAVSTLILAAALKILSDTDPNKLSTATLALSLAMASLVGCIALLMRIPKTSIVKSMSINFMLLSLSVSMLLLATALKKLSDIEPDKLFTALMGMWLLMSEMMIFMRAAKADKDMIKSAAGLMILSGALIVLSVAVERFSNINKDKMVQGLVGVGVALAELAGFTRLAGNPKDVIQTSLALVALSGSMIILSKAVELFGAQKVAVLKKGLISIGIALAEITLALRFMPEDMLSKAAGLVLVAGALTAMSGAMVIIGGLSWEAIAKGIVALGASMTILAAGLTLMDSTIQGSAALAIAAASFSLLVPALLLMDKVSWTSIAKGMAILAGVLVLFGVASLVLTEAVPAMNGIATAVLMIGLSVAAVGAGVLMIGAGLMAIGVGMAEIAAVGTTGATAFVAVVAVIIDGLMELIPTIIDKFKEIISSLCNLIGDMAPEFVEAILKLLSSALDSLKEYMPSIVDSLLTILADVINQLADHAPEIVTSIVNLISAIVGVIVDELNNLDPGQLENTLMSIHLVTMVATELAALTALVPLAMGGVGMAGALIAQIALMLTELSSLANIKGLKEMITTGGNILQDVGTAIGQFIGGITGGIAEGVTAVLPQIGTDLSDFMVTIQPFLEAASKIDPSIVVGVAALTAAMLMISGAEIMNGIASFFAGEDAVKAFGNDISELGKGIAGFAEAVDGVKLSTVTEAAQAAGIIAQAAGAIPNTGGVAAFFAGDNDVKKFAEKLGDFGSGIADFAAAVIGVKVDKVSAAAIAAKYIAEAAANIPNSGGVASLFAGENDVAEFADKLEGFGDGIAKFGVQVEGVKPDEIKAAAIAAKYITEAAENIPNSGGVASWFAGDNDIDTFANSLETFGKGIKSFGNSVKKLNTDDISNATSVMTPLFKALGEIPNSGGVAAFFAGENDVDTFGDALKVFGLGLKSFSMSVKSLNTTGIRYATEATDSLVEIAKKIPNTGGVASFFAGDNDFNGFASSVENLGNGIAAFSSSIANIEGSNEGITTIVDSIVNAVKSLQSINVSNINDALHSLTSINLSVFSKTILQDNTAINAVEIWINKIVSKIISSDVYLNQAISKVIQGMIEKCANELNTGNGVFQLWINKLLVSIGTNAYKFSQAGTNLSIAFKSGMLSEIGSGIAGRYNHALQDTLTMIRGFTSEFVSAGQNLTRGFIDGIGSQLDDGTVANTGKKLGDTAYKATKKSLDIRSPSKKMKELGYYTVAGFVNGVTSESGNITNAVNTLMGGFLDSADAAIGDTNSIAEKFSKALSSIVNADSLNLDTMPSIRPVLDLSDMETGITRMNSMFENKHLNVAPIAGLASELSRRMLGDIYIQNGGNDDNNKPAPSSNDTYNFYITSTDPKQAAEEINKILGRQVQRRDAVWDS